MNLRTRGPTTPVACGSSSNKDSEMNVLITGMSGLIGRLINVELSQRHNIRALCRTPIDGFEQVNASITDYDSILPAFKNIDVVVHLAAYREDEPVVDLFSTNVEGTRNVFRAAVESGAWRVVFGSSAGLIRGHLTGRSFLGDGAGVERKLLTGESPPWPVRPYDVTKVAGEAIARSFNETHGLETVCVRIGKCVAADIPVEGVIRPLWVSQRDLTQLMARCVEHPGPLGFEIVYGISANSPPVVDLARSKQVFGYRPQDGCEWH